MAYCIVLIPGSVRPSANFLALSNDAFTVKEGQQQAGGEGKIEEMEGDYGDFLLGL